MKIDRLDNREAIRALRDELNAALQGVGEKHGLKIEAGKCTMSTHHCRFHLEVSMVDASSGQVHNRESEDYTHYARRFNLNPDWLGKSFTVRGRSYKIIGLKPRAGTRPVIADSGGKQYVFPATMVRSAFGSTAIPSGQQIADEALARILNS